MSTPPKGPDGELSYMQARFIEEYTIDPTNAKAAACRAGYSPKTAASQASQMLKRPHIASKIEDINEEVAANLGLTKERLLRELMNIAFLNPKHLVKQDADGNTFVDLRDVPDEVAAAVTGLSVTNVRGGGKDVKFSLSDKQNALVTLAKMLGWHKDRVDVNAKLSLADLLSEVEVLEQQDTETSDLGPTDS